ncbi:Flp family type IVb pilin [Endozoicomonas sp.]|uniref:Flp family type IVb pilin n=1 Tax=Endozoicomonas sp. TaxID=1892382 RepID=UPI003AF7E31A
MNVKQWVNDFLKEEDGLTTVEYAVAGGVVAAAVVTAFTDLGGQVKTVLETIKASIAP